MLLVQKGNDEQWRTKQMCDIADRCKTMRSLKNWKKQGVFVQEWTDAWEVIALKPRRRTSVAGASAGRGRKIVEEVERKARERETGIQGYRVKRPSACGGCLGDHRR